MVLDVTQEKWETVMAAMASVKGNQKLTLEFVKSSSGD